MSKTSRKNAATAATIRQVALAAGVSVGTVSRVLNHQPNISPENLERVQQAMQELGYQRNESARRLGCRSSGITRTGNIGFFLTGMGTEWSGHPLLAQYVQGVEKACREGGYHPVLEFGDGQAPNALPKFLIEGKVDGVVVKGGVVLPEWLKSPPLPVVGVGMNEPSLNLLQVAPDNRMAGWSVTEHLWSLGHRKIAFINTDDRHAMFLHRQQGWEEFLRTSGAYTPHLLYCQHATDAIPHTPERALPDLDDLVQQLQRQPKTRTPTAMVCCNDWAAAGLYRALQRQGLTPGKDISIIGIDNDQTLCNALNPPLASHTVPIPEAALLATRLLIQHLNAPEHTLFSGTRYVCGELVLRASISPLS